MDLPGHYEPTSSSENGSDTSFSPALMDHLEAVAQLSDSQDEDRDPDWNPDRGQAGEALDEFDDDDEDEDDDHEEDEDEDEELGDADARETGAEADAGRGALQIGYDRVYFRSLSIVHLPMRANPWDTFRRFLVRRSRSASSGTVVLIGDDGQPRRLTARDLEGTSITLGAIRAMLARRFGARTRIVDDDDEDDEDAEMEDDDEDSDGGGDWWGSVAPSRSDKCTRVFQERSRVALLATPRPPSG